jgi:hypothetical protein
MLAHLLLTFQHRAGVRPYTSNFFFAESCVLDKQSLPPLMCHLSWVAPKKVPFIPKLQGQFAEFLQHHSLKRLGMLYQSTSVGLGYGLKDRAISWKKETCKLKPLRTHNLILPSTPARCRNINLLPIDYDFRPRLRGRLTLRGLPLHRNPWTFGGSVFHTPLRYSCQHSHFRYLQKSSRPFFDGLRNAPLLRALASGKNTPTFSVHDFSPVTFSAQTDLIRLVSYYAFFKGWLLLSQPPSCLGRFTSFST